ncbi:MAG TPA: M23 family metallopeptidase [Bacteroidota bacterium]|nr:M23 family metallopeptidase [Bacteroidota bacterium]
MLSLKKALLFVAGIAAGLAVFVTTPADTAWVAGGPTPASSGVGLSYPDPDSVNQNFKGYIWPTDASRKITSSFAEYRSDHFHGGIDISTNGTVGHKVYSVQDGFLYRIRITPNGYGKMLYVRHPDGYVSTYAHLKSFNGQIGELARAEQYRTGSYEIDLIYETPVVRLKKGEVIAYTGDTGFGPPHLHFEIRDSDLNPVNPLLGRSFRMEDNLPPTIYRFLVRPLAAGSTVNNSEKPRIYSRIPRKYRAYRIAEKIRVQGEIGFAVETKDRSNGVGGRTGVYTMELIVAGDTVFRASLNAVPLDKTKQIYIHYDLPMIVEGKGRFQKLYIERGNELPLYAGTPADGGIIRTDRLSEGDHEYTVRCTDIYGNTSTLSGTIVVAHPPVISLGAVTDGSITLINRSRSPLAAVSVQGKRQFAAAWIDHTLTGSRLGPIGDTIVVPVNTGQYDILKIAARTEKGSWSEPLFYNRRKETGPAHRLYVDHRLAGDDLKITLSSAGVITDRPTVIVSEGLRTSVVPMKAVDVSSFVGYYPLPPRNSEPRTIRAEAGVNGHRVSAEEQSDLYSIPHDGAGEFTSVRDGFSVSYDSGAVFRPLHFTVGRESESGSTIYTFEPRDVLLNRGIRVSLPVDANDNGTPGIYYRANKGWVLLNATPGVFPGKISGDITTLLGEVAVLTDGTAPTVGLLRLRVSGGKPSFSFRYHDNLSGVDLEKSVVTIDDAVVIPEIDGEHRRVKYAGTERAKKGKHLLKIVLRDRVGNESSVQRWFTVR